MDDDFDHGEERSVQVRRALLKALAAVVVIGVVVALGTTLVVRALGLNESESSDPVGAAPGGPVKPLPTKALPVPGENKGDEPTQEPSESASPDAGRNGKIDLQVLPASARPMERVNLTGTYQGADNVGLQVQRFEEDGWADFGVTVNVRLGVYSTYVMTGRAGEQRFRVFDPRSGEGSNAVQVTIG